MREKSSAADGETTVRPRALETVAAHFGGYDPAFGALSPVICLSTNFERTEEGTLPGGFLYSRSGNPNRLMLESALAELEAGAVCITFASGSAATAAVFQSLDPGNHVIAPTSAYYGTGEQLRTIFARWGLNPSFVDMTDLRELERALEQPTRLVWLETPANPLLAITDIARAAEIAHAAGAKVVVDNSWATPVLQRPLALGADFVVHSTTKYLGGHGDVTGGAVVSKEAGEISERLRTIQDLSGAVPSPFDCWLVLRGIRTLPLRMRAHCATAQDVAEFLDEHPAVSLVHYPGLPHDVGHGIAARQMSGFGGMLSIRVNAGAEAALRVVRHVKLFRRATSLGGPESLIEHRASVESPSSGTPDDLLRLSIGLEHSMDLISDLESALARV